MDHANVAQGLASLIAPTSTGYRCIAQQKLNLCGPAALLVMAMDHDPVAVMCYATEFFDTGTGSIGGFTVSASEALLGTDFEQMRSRSSAVALRRKLNEWC